MPGLFAFKNKLKKIQEIFLFFGIFSYINKHE